MGELARGCLFTKINYSVSHYTVKSKLHPPKPLVADSANLNSTQLHHRTELRRQTPQHLPELFIFSDRAEEVGVLAPVGEKHTLGAVRNDTDVIVS